MVPRILVETVPNPMVRVYHTTIEISQSSCQIFQRPFRDTSENYLKEVGKIGAQLLKDVFALPGVVKVFIEPYELFVIKAHLFNWEDIEPGVIEALKKAFGEEAPEIIGATYLPTPEVSPEKAVAKVLQTQEKIPAKELFRRGLNLIKKFLQKFLSLGKRFVNRLIRK